MKIISFKGGLGNQIFEYLFYLHLRQNKTNEKIYGFYASKYLERHNGLEISEVFDINLPSQPFYICIIVAVCKLLNKFGLRYRINIANFSNNGIYYDDWWQDKKFFEKNIDFLKFHELQLNRINSDILLKIKETNSVAIHVRRGDYLSPQFIGIYGNVCTLDYYSKAIERIKKETKDPAFYIFSDDIDWVKQNFDLKKSVFIDWNKGQNSFFDLYLMTHCKHHIIANSTFSFWGARLSQSKSDSDSFNIYPAKWYNSKFTTPDIFPSSWIG